MKTLHAVLISILVLVASVGAGDDSFKIWVRLDTPHQLNGSALIFSGEDMAVRLSIDVYGPNVFPAGWNEHLRWRITPESGEAYDVPQSSVKADSSFHRGKKVPVGSAAETGNAALETTFSFPTPPPGKYTLQARLDHAGKAVVSEGQSFLVRRADVEDEDDHFESIRLRTLINRLRSNPVDCQSEECRKARWEEYKKLMLRLAEVEPANPKVWEQLGDRSLTAVPPEETMNYYARARRLAEKNLLEKYGSIKALPAAVREEYERYDREMTLFARQVYPYLIKNPNVPVIADSTIRRSKMFLAYPDRSGKQLTFSDGEKPRAPGIERR